jgi:hypothetical protein
MVYGEVNSGSSKALKKLLPELKLDALEFLLMLNFFDSGRFSFS